MKAILALHSSTHCAKINALGNGSQVHRLKLQNIFLPKINFLTVTRRGVGSQRFVNSQVSVRASSEEKATEIDYDYDLFTIGAGSGGVRASRFASSYGAKTAVCELPFSTISSEYTGGIGGTCVIRGCVPKKLLMYGSKFQHEFESSKGFGWTIPSEPHHDWSTLIRNKNKELERLTNAYRNTLKNAKVEIIEGRGIILDPHTVEVNGKRYTSKNILIAVGGRPFVPEIPGREYAITSDEALDLPERPKKIVIVGGGYIALEFASIFRALGSEVDVIIRQPKILRGFDHEVRDFLTERLEIAGIRIHPNATPEAIEKLPDGQLALSISSGEKISADSVMFATGRKANTKNLGLSELGVELDKSGAIVVDKYSRTSVPSIWAVGDVTDRINLTPVALMEGMAFAKTAFLGQPTEPDYRYVASAVFTQPPVGSCGLTEEQAVAEFGDVDIYTSSFRPMKATISGLNERVFMKLVVESKTEKVVGAHMVGDDSAEILQGLAIAMKMGSTKSDFDSTVGIHPSAAEEFVTMRSVSRRIRNGQVQQ